MVRKHCEVCGGKGTIKDPKGNGKAIYLPEMTCPNCDGEGFIGVPENISIKKPFYRPTFLQKTLLLKEKRK